MYYFITTYINSYMSILQNRYFDCISFVEREKYIALKLSVIEIKH